MVSKGNSIESMKSRTSQSDVGEGDGEKRKSRLAFGKNPVKAEYNEDFDDAEQERNLSLLSDAIGEREGSRRIGLSSKKKAKLVTGDRRTSKNDVQKRMMEAAMVLQTQEFM